MKTKIIERLEAVLSALATIKFGSEAAEGKKLLSEQLRRGSTGYGVVADNLESLRTVKALFEETKQIKRTEFPDIDKFSEALDSHRQSAISAIETVLEEVKALPEDSGEPDETTGTLGTRTKFILELHPVGQNPVTDIVQKTSGDLAKHFLESAWAKKSLEPDEVLATCIRNSITKPVEEGGLGLEWVESKPGRNDVFYKLYRLIRPTVLRGLEKLRKADENPVADENPAAENSDPAAA